MPTIKGTNKSDFLTGSNSADKIQAQSGNDTIHALGGNDAIDAGGGDDLIVSGTGSDTIDGGLGIDTLDYSGWSGRVTVQFGGYATSTTGVGSVQEIDSTGAILSTDEFSAIENIIATGGNDLLYGGGGANIFWGGTGDDRLNGGNGNDTLYGGAGDDLIDVGNGNDTTDGGDGIDTLFWDHGGLLGAVVDLQAGRISYDPAYGPDNWDIILNFENVRGRDGNKHIYGTDGSNTVQGSSGSDVIEGRGGDDVLVGDYGRYTGGINGSAFGYDDTIIGGAGNDLLSGDLGNDILSGGSGADIFVVDSYYGTDRITDFEDGVDRLALYDGLTITGWENRDTDGDGSADSSAALLSNGEAILFNGLNAPASLVDGTAVVHHADHFAIPELAGWTAEGGSPWDANTAASLYLAAGSAPADSPAASFSLPELTLWP